MDDKQTRKYTAGVTAQSVMDDNNALWAGKPPIVAKKTKLDNDLLKIEQLQDAQENDNTGNAVAKAAAKKAAANDAWIHAKVLSAFATDINNDELRNAVDFEMSDLLFVKDSKAIERWTTVHDRGDDNIAALTAGGYDITPATLIALKAKIVAFDALKTAPRSAQVVSKAATEAMVLAFDELNKTAIGLKELLAPFVVTAIDFYNEMIDAFEIVNTGVRHIGLRVTYTDSITGGRLVGVKAEIIELTLQKQSSERGIVDYSQQELPEGNYTLVSALPNYTQDTQINLPITKGKILRLNIKLVKV